MMLNRKLALELHIARIATAGVAGAVVVAAGVVD